jgi:NADH-quinone oxidoreductase subunit H
MCGLATLLFLGGWHSGVLPFEPVERFGVILGNIVDAVMFITKGSLLVLVMMWVRWSLPRIRLDHVMLCCLKYFLPISCGLLVGVGVWLLFVPKAIGELVRYVLAITSVLSVLLLFVTAWRGGIVPQTSGAFTPPT